MTRSLYNQLIAVLDVFIEEFGGQIRFRGIQTWLLVQKASLTGQGISVSEVRAVTGAPLENIRRHFTRQVALGSLISYTDPEDERVVRYQVEDPDTHQRVARRMATRLNAIGPPDGATPERQRSFNSGTYDALIDVLQAYADFLDSGLRIRAFKMAGVMLQTSLSSTGMTASEIARQSGAPLENVRRYIRNYVESGALEVIENPNDSRASLVLFKNPERVAQVFEAIAARLNGADWTAFNLNPVDT